VHIKPAYAIVLMSSQPWQKHNLTEIIYAGLCFKAQQVNSHLKAPVWAIMHLFIVPDFSLHIVLNWAPAQTFQGHSLSYSGRITATLTERNWDIRRRKVRL